MFTGEKEHLMAMCKGMMEKMKMKAGEDPMALCKEMCEKISAGGDPMAMCKEMMEKKNGKCC